MKKRVFAVLFAMILLCACLPLSAVSAEEEDELIGIEYRIVDGEVTITGHNEGRGGFFSGTIPATIEGCPVTKIADDAYSGCSCVVDLTIPDTVVYIGDGAFADCSNLEYVTIPDSVKHIGDNAFNGCSSLKTGNLPKGLTSIGAGVYMHTSLYFSIKEEYQNGYFNTVFMDYGEEDPIEFEIKEGTTAIAGSAFQEGRLTSVTIPDSVTYIGTDAFRDCQFLTSVTIPDSVTYIGGYAFCYSYLESITLSKGLTEISNGLFSQAHYLETVNMPNGITTIGEYAFENTALTSIVIPATVTKIKESAFELCEDLTTVYYCGSEEDWANLSIATGNDYLLSADVQFNYVMPKPEDDVADSADKSDDSDKSDNSDKSDDSDKDEDSDKGGSAAGLWIVIAVGVLLIGGVVAFLLLKKKKSA